MSHSFKESTVRSIVKTVSWRVLATITTIILVYLFTDEISLAFQVGMIEVFLKMLVYFFHERAWDKINFGREEIEIDETIQKK
jgi:adenylylsulfate kinase